MPSGAVAQVAPLVAQKQVRPHAADQNLINFIRPGIGVKVVSAAIAADGTITARVTISDPKGLPLDMAGIATPGAVTLRLIAAYIPAGQKQFVSYTTTLAKATLNSNPSQTQAANDTGGTWKTNAIGDYTYTFATKAPANFDATATHAIGVSAQRDLSEFITYAEFAETANDVFNFVPNGSAVKVIRSVVPTSACNNCHDPLFGHGGSRLTVEMCILCHTPQTINPDTKLTQDMNVLIHKIHMGKNLPSVKAGTPYRIWHRGAWSDFSDVGFPSGTDELKTCTVCHQNAPQADNYATAPSRAACGSCHDNVNFVTGENHVNLPQADDKLCTTCHNPKGELEFDASIKGAHTVANRSATLPGIVLQVQNVTNTAPGQAPTVTFKVADKGGNPVDISKLTYIRVLLSGPNVDYQVGTGGIRVSEDPSKTPGSGGIYTYTMTNKIPAAAAGSYTISLEARNSVTLLRRHGQADHRHRCRQARAVLLLGGQEQDGGPPRGGDHREVRRLPRGPDTGPRRQPRRQPGVRPLPQPDAGRWNLQAERQLCNADSQHPSRQGPGESLRARNHQLSGSRIPRRPARLHHLPCGRHLSGG